MSKFIFLILHYYTHEDTIKCVESIKKLNYTNYEIVIVDNGSQNLSGKLLKDKYKDDSKIHVILSEKNLGFANGNNLGFKYIKENLKADFIIMCNNDVYMIQKDFCAKIVEEYEKSAFALLGPQILLKNNEICNYEDTLPSLTQLKLKLITTYAHYYLNKVYLKIIYALCYRIKNIFKRKNIVNISRRKENVIIHGCCMIFSSVYIKKFEGIDNRTFLYYEEPLLYIRLRKNNMKSVYNPNIKIFHNEGVATNKTIKNKRNKVDFILKNEISSLKVLISEVKQ